MCEIVALHDVFQFSSSFTSTQSTIWLCNEDTGIIKQDQPWLFWLFLPYLCLNCCCNSPDHGYIIHNVGIYQTAIRRSWQDDWLGTLSAVNKQDLPFNTDQPRFHWHKVYLSWSIVAAESSGVGRAAGAVMMSLRATDMYNQVLGQRSTAGENIQADFNKSQWWTTRLRRFSNEWPDWDGSVMNDSHLRGFIQYLRWFSNERLLPAVIQCCSKTVWNLVGFLKRLQRAAAEETFSFSCCSCSSTTNGRTPSAGKPSRPSTPPPGRSSARWPRPTRWLTFPFLTDTEKHWQ